MDMNGKAFNEYVTRRCEEILQRDEIYQKINSLILIEEGEFIKSLNPEQLKKYLSIESLSMDQKAHDSNLLYINGFKDKNFM